MFIFHLKEISMTNKCPGMCVPILKMKNESKWHNWLHLFDKIRKIKALQFKIIDEMSSAEDALIRINRSVKGLNLFKNFKNIFMFIWILYLLLLNPLVWHMTYIHQA